MVIFHQNLVNSLLHTSIKVPLHGIGAQSLIDATPKFDIFEWVPNSVQHLVYFDFGNTFPKHYISVTCIYSLELTSREIQHTYSLVIPKIHGQFVLELLSWKVSFQFNKVFQN